MIEHVVILHALLGGLIFTWVHYLSISIAIMVRFCLSTVGVVGSLWVVLLAGSSLGGPIRASAVDVRSRPVCANAPNVIAGT